MEPATAVIKTLDRLEEEEQVDNDASLKISETQQHLIEPEIEEDLLNETHTSRRATIR